MSNVQPRIADAATSLAGIAFELATLVTDGALDRAVRARLVGLAEALRVEDILLDYELMSQIWRLGRHAAPNRPLTARLADHARAQNAPASCTLAEAS